MISRSYIRLLRQAGDGVYCFEDWEGRYGCHGAAARPGQYHYEFWGVGPGGHHSNHMTVTVTVEE